MEALKKLQPGSAPPQKATLFFKIFCYLHPENVPIDSIEASFMYEQVSLQILTACMHSILSSFRLLMTSLHTKFPATAVLPSWVHSAYCSIEVYRYIKGVLQITSKSLKHW